MKTVLFVVFTLTVVAAGITAQTVSQVDSVTHPPWNRVYDRPIDPDQYLIRPGEQLLVTFVKTSLPSMLLKVNAEGKIVDQNLGEISVTDKTLTEARRTLTEILLASYHAEDIVISVGAPYLVSIQVSGAVNAPGRYCGYTSQTVSEIIDSAGGVRLHGSSRLIRLSAPLQDYNVDLDRVTYLADVEADPCLYGGLSIFVPSRSVRTVHVTGAVRVPREIELIDGDDLNLLIALAGGPRPQADVAASYIMNDSGRNPAEPGAIATGDIIMVPYAGGVAQGEDVCLFGAVGRNGRFLYQPGMTLEQLLNQAGGLTVKANPARITIFRKAESNVWTNQDEGRYALSVESGGHDRLAAMKLSPSDSIFIPVMLGYVKVSGDVRHPGLYVYEDGKNAGYYIANAGGYTENHGSVSVRLFDRISKVTREITTGVIARDGDEITVSLSGATP